MNRKLSKLVGSRNIIKKKPKFDELKFVSCEPETKIVKPLQKHALTEWVIFKYHAPPGSEIFVAGTFNNWDPTAIRLSNSNTEIYTATVQLPLGKYEYKFIVNGEWRNGPEKSTQVSNAYGTTNNVLVVKRTPDHKGHLRAFSRPSFSEDRPRYTTPLGE